MQLGRLLELVYDTFNLWFHEVNGKYGKGGGIYCSNSCSSGFSSLNRGYILLLNL